MHSFPSSTIDLIMVNEHKWDIYYFSSEPLFHCGPLVLHKVVVDFILGLGIAHMNWRWKFTVWIISNALIYICHEIYAPNLLDSTLFCNLDICFPIFDWRATLINNYTPFPTSISQSYPSISKAFLIVFCMLITYPLVKCMMWKIVSPEHRFASCWSTDEDNKLLNFILGNIVKPCVVWLTSLFL